MCIRDSSISGHVVHGRKLGRNLGASEVGGDDGFRTLNLRFSHPKPAAAGIFAVRVHGLGAQALDGVASLGKRPTVDDSGRVLLEVHVFDFNQGCYGRQVRVEFLQKIRDEEKYVDLPTLTAAIHRDADIARAYFARRDGAAATAGDLINATNATDRI